jgi:hypothetical protein
MVNDITWSVTQPEGHNSSVRSNASSSSSRLALQSIVDATNSLERLW